MTNQQNRCGHPTATGPCKNPATEDNHCWIESHGGTVSGHGRPSKLNDAWGDVMDAAERGLTIEGIARAAGIGVETLRDWRRTHDDFSGALNRARAVAEKRLIEDASAEFVLERSYGYVKSQEVELSGEVEMAGLSSEEKQALNELFDRDPQ